jgi:ribonuclease HI
VVFKNKNTTNSLELAYTSKSNIGYNQLVYNGELEAITQAMEYASEQASPNQHYYIYADNQASLLRLKTPSDNPGQDCQIRATLASELASNKGAKITLNWVPGHTEIPGNELVDKLAKEATKLEPISDTTSFAVLGTKIKQASTREWHQILKEAEQKQKSRNPHSYIQQFPWKIRKKIQLALGTKRATASAFFQLKLGHGYIKSYLHRLGYSDDKCQCGQKENVEHLLIQCELYKEERAKLQEALKVRLNLKVLLHTQIGIERTIEFLKNTSICTRKWHLARIASEGNG